MKKYDDIGKENSAAERIAPECFCRSPFLLLDLLPWRWPYIQMDNSCVNANASHGAVLHDKTGICKIPQRTQFLVLHTRVFHLPLLFYSSHPRGNEAFSLLLYFTVMSLECVNTMSSTAGQARPANPASNVMYE